MSNQVNFLVVFHCCCHCRPTDAPKAAVRWHRSSESWWLYWCSPSSNEELPPSSKRGYHHPSLSEVYHDPVTITIWWWKLTPTRKSYLHPVWQGYYQRRKTEGMMARKAPVMIEHNMRADIQIYQWRMSARKAPVPDRTQDDIGHSAIPMTNVGPERPNHGRTQTYTIRNVAYLTQSPVDS